MGKTIARRGYGVSDSKYSLKVDRNETEPAAKRRPGACCLPLGNCSLAISVGIWNNPLSAEPVTFNVTFIPKRPGLDFLILN